MPSRVRASIVLAAASLAGCGTAAPPAAQHASSRRPSIAEGRALFVREHCGACHALAALHARGGSGPDFDTSERLARAQLRLALVAGANGMPSYAGRLAPRQLDALSAFLFAATHRAPAR